MLQDSPGFRVAVPTFSPSLSLSSLLSSSVLGGRGTAWGWKPPPSLTYAMGGRHSVEHREAPGSGPSSPQTSV